MKTSKRERILKKGPVFQPAAFCRHVAPVCFDISPRIAALCSPGPASATSRCPAVSQGLPASAPAWPRSAAPLKAPHNLERLTDREMCVLLFRHLRIPLSISQIHCMAVIKCSCTAPIRSLQSLSGREGGKKPATRPPEKWTGST